MTFLINTFCALLITCATLVVQSANPVYSVLYLILAFFNASALVLLCGHDYMAALFIVLYVGAMCTFFLFAIMILDIKVEQVSEKRLKQTPVNAILAVIFALQCKNLLNDTVSPIMLKAQCRPLTSDLLDHTTQIYSLGAVLYTTYAWHLILASLILLSAMLGSIVLTLNKSSGGKSQQIYEQNLRDFMLTVTKHR
jgi:NADH-quinone oxidoreductase subunit J